MNKLGWMSIWPDFFAQWPTISTTPTFLERLRKMSSRTVIMWGPAAYKKQPPSIPALTVKRSSEWPTWESAAAPTKWRNSSSLSVLTVCWQSIFCEHSRSVSPALAFFFRLFFSLMLNLYCWMHNICYICILNKILSTNNIYKILQFLRFTKFHKRID